MTVWVTGPGGLLGSHVAATLRAVGHEVLPVGREAVPDLAAADAVERLRALKAPGAVVHCAAAIPTAACPPEGVAAINRKMDDNLLVYLREHPVRLVFISGVSVYRDYGRPGLLDEDSPAVPQNCRNAYFREKCVSEKGFLDAGGTVLRVSSPYGTGQRHKNVLALFVEKIRENKDITLYGDGSRTQDFVHAADVARAAVLALAGDEPDVYNIVSGRPVSMRQLAETTISCCPGYAGKRVYLNQPDPQAGFRAEFSRKKAQSRLGWVPQVALEEGLLQLLREADG